MQLSNIFKCDLTEEVIMYDISAFLIENKYTATSITGV